MKKMIFLLALCAMNLFASDQPKVVRTKAFKVEIYGKGRPMVLIPGLACSGEVWDATVDHFKSQYECHVLTLAGFAGEAPIVPPFLENVVTELSLYVQKLDHPIVIGHSLGGFIAMQLAIKNPDRLGALIIVDTYPFLAAFQQPDATIESVKPQAEMLKKMVSTQPRDQYKATQPLVLQSMISDSAQVRRALEWGLASDFATVGEAMYEVMTTDLRKAIADIHCPVMVLGSWSAMQKFGATKEWAAEKIKNLYAALPGVQVTMAEKARHFIMLDEPEWFREQVQTFVTQHSSTSGLKPVK
ncbi:alpha/beta hydrolase [bacterium]|nr:alpha/beta hydrolase [bacterium]